MVKASLLGLMAGIIKEVILMIKRKVMVFLLGLMEGYTVEIGSEANNLVKEYIKVSMEWKKKEYGQKVEELGGLMTNPLQ